MGGELSLESEVGVGSNFFFTLSLPPAVSDVIDQASRYSGVTHLAEGYNIFMTDGIIEAMDSEERYYSDSGRLEKTISQFTNEMSAEAMVDAVINAAMDFGGGKAERDDDMTVVVAKVL